MNCKQAHDDIALYVGNDLSDTAVQRLERHLAQCPSCKKHYQNMSESWKMLRESGDQLLVSSLHDSVWPDVSVQLAKNHRERHKFNGWIPATAVLAASFIIFLVSDFSVQQPVNTSPSMPASFNSNPIPFQGISNIGPAEENELKLEEEKKKAENNRFSDQFQKSDQFLKYIYSPVDK